jgi:hypothetical protein
MALQNFLPELLFSLVDVCVQFVPVLPDRKLLIVVDGDLDFPVAVGLVIGVVELGHVGVLEGLLG